MTRNRVVKSHFQRQLSLKTKISAEFLSVQSRQLQKNLYYWSHLGRVEAHEWKRYQQGIRADL